jgi:tetratricopeptide (TPR) repeat protein
MVHTTLWMRVFEFFVSCWSRVGRCPGCFWLREAALASGLALTGALLLSPGHALAATMMTTTNAQQDSVLGPAATARAKQAAADALQALHREEEWMRVAKFLPDIEKGTGAELETAADVLRARRFPEEALEYYLAAYRNGGNKQQILNKLGVTELIMHHPDRARAYFRMTLKKDKKNSDAWNNLGATEYVDGHYQASVSDYRKALKLNPASSVFHSNLGTALIGEKDFSEARKEFAAALEIDPEFGTRSSEGGISAHVLSAEDRARFCLEMARVYAAKGKIDAMLHSLVMAADGGVNLTDAMYGDPILVKFSKDPRVTTIISNAKAMKKTSVASVGPLEPLPAETN